MAVIVRLNEKKEPINELLGSVLAVGLVVGLLAKLFGLKFNYSNTDEMSQIGLSLFNGGINFARKKIKNSSNLTPEEQAKATNIIDDADLNIRRTVQRNNQAIEKNPALAKTLHTNEQVMSILDKAVADIRNLLGGDEQKTEEIVEPLRNSVNDLNNSLKKINSKAAIAQLSQDPGLSNAIKRASRGKLSDENVQIVMAKIAERVKS